MLILILILIIVIFILFWPTLARSGISNSAISASWIFVVPEEEFPDVRPHIDEDYDEVDGRRDQPGNRVGGSLPVSSAVSARLRRMKMPFTAEIRERLPFD